MNQSERLDETLKAVGVSCTFVKVVDAGHGDFSSQEVGRRIRQFLDRYLRDQAVEVADAPILRESARAQARR